MSGEAGGWMWMIVDVGAVLVLGLALMFGVMAWRKRRSRAMNRVRDRKTEELYRRPDPDENAPFTGR